MGNYVLYIKIKKAELLFFKYMFLLFLWFAEFMHLNSIGNRERAHSGKVANTNMNVGVNSTKKICLRTCSEILELELNCN